MLILIRNSILYIILDKLPNLLPFLEILALQLINRSTLTIIGAYRYSNFPLTMSIINSIFMKFKTQFPSVLLKKDFSAHHSFSGSTCFNSILYEFIDSLNLSCFNPDSMPIFFSHFTRAPSIIDLVFSSSDIFPIYNINIGQDLMNSDHFFYLCYDQLNGSFC